MSLRMYRHTPPPCLLRSWRRIVYPQTSISESSTKSSSHDSVIPITAAFVLVASKINSFNFGSKLRIFKWIKCKPFLKNVGNHHL